MEKPVRFLGTSLQDLRRFPPEVRRTAGFEFDQVQRGCQPRDFKPVPEVGQGVYEIRIREEGQAYRVFYVAKREGAIYLLHAFEKETQRTPGRDLEI